MTSRGADAFRRRSIGWDPNRQEVRVERARIHRPDGSVVDAHDESEQSASEPWYRLYYDTRAKTLSFPSLAAGDVLEIAWRVEDVAKENLLSDYWGDVASVDEGTRKLLFDRVVLVPEGRALHASVPSGVARTEKKLAGGLVEHRFVARDLPRIVTEPAMPGWSEVGRTVHVSTYASWDDVARFYWGLVQEQLHPTAEVRASAARIGLEALATRGPAPRPNGAAAEVRPAALAPPAGGWDPATKRLLVEAVYDFVVTQTRYVGLEFGIHGFKPYRVDEVLRRRFGDCKDKASLMHALLEALGIDSRLVLLRMRRLGVIPPEPASLAVFNHAILYVPDLDLFLDGTASWTGSRELPGRGPRRRRAGGEPGRAAAVPHRPRGAPPRRTGPRAASRSPSPRTAGRRSGAPRGSPAPRRPSTAAPTSPPTTAAHRPRRPSAGRSPGSGSSR